MKISKFEIANFKGVSKATINIADDIPGNVVSFIGLNESGKTTILEALSYFITEDQDIASIVEKIHRKSSLQDLIPKDRKAAFTGSISIKAYVDLDYNDKKSLADHFSEKHKLILDVASLPKFTAISRTFNFEDSDYKSANIIWSINFKLLTANKKSYTEYVSSGDTRDVWLSGINFLREKLPKDSLFPDFPF